MKSSIRIAAAALALATLGSMALAAPPEKTAKMPDTMKCPYCKMTMPSKKSDKTPVAVKIKGHTYYCCSHCGPNKKK